MNSLIPLFDPTAEPRQRILTTALILFYRDGIRATGIDRIIAEANVAKLTFYRNFASKNELILAFLSLRHERWMAWFDDALRRHGDTLAALVPALREWFAQEDFRGCAFINSVAELGKDVSQIVTLSRSHKEAMVQRIVRLMPGSDHAADQVTEDAGAIALAVDGAILRVQFEQNPDATLRSLERILTALIG